MDLLSGLTPVLTTIVGGLIGFLAARMMWEIQETRRRKSVAQAFLLELGSLERMLAGFARVLQSPPGGSQVRIESPLYPSYGLYYTLQKDLFSLSPELSGPLFQFYLRILEADRLREFSPTDPRFALMQDGVRSALASAVSQLPDLKVRLSREIGRSAAL
ncbi:MAG: hypothetical protein HY047_06820 [Acidobacteria bacterium]|nr:hypothetical protein [Acidobacteriota bacterium]